VGVSAKAGTGVEQFKNPAAALNLADAQAGKDAGAALATLAKLKAQPETAALGEARDTLAQASALKDSAPNAQLLAQLQPAQLAAAQLAAGVSADHIPARVGSSGWDQQVGQKIVLMAGDGEQRAELTLNPPDLGPLQVVLNVSNDQASVQFSSNQLEVRQALENALPRLREMMSESGIALGNATVNAGTQDQRQAQGDGQPGSGRGSSSRFDSSGAVAETATRTTRITHLGDNGMVDTFA
jgi:flagellar hook-length control protein FliK